MEGKSGLSDALKPWVDAQMKQQWEDMVEQNRQLIAEIDELITSRGFYRSMARQLQDQVELLRKQIEDYRAVLRHELKDATDIANHEVESISTD